MNNKVWCFCSDVTSVSSWLIFILEITPGRSIGYFADGRLAKSCSTTYFANKKVTTKPTKYRYFYVHFGDQSVLCLAIEDPNEKQKKIQQNRIIVVTMGKSTKIT